MSEIYQEGKAWSDMADQHVQTAASLEQSTMASAWTECDTRQTFDFDDLFSPFTPPYPHQFGADVDFGPALGL